MVQTFLVPYLCPKGKSKFPYKSATELHGGLGVQNAHSISSVKIIWWNYRCSSTSDLAIVKLQRSPQNLQPGSEVRTATPPPPHDLTTAMHIGCSATGLHLQCLHGHRTTIYPFIYIYTLPILQSEAVLDSLQCNKTAVYIFFLKTAGNQHLHSVFIKNCP